jgi:UDP:flavonoid glycosyltransferase YjiC (YdhE family)
VTGAPATILAYVDAVPGRLCPLVAGLLELRERGHRVAVRCGARDLEALNSVGIPAESLAPEIARFDPDDWRARTRFGALRSGLAQFADRAPFQVPDLQRAIETERADVLFIDEGSWGAAAAAEHSGLPWAYSVVSAMPLPSRDAPASASASRLGMISSGGFATDLRAGSRSGRSSA